MESLLQEVKEKILVFGWKKGALTANTQEMPKTVKYINGWLRTNSDVFGDLAEEYWDQIRLYYGRSAGSPPKTESLQCRAVAAFGHFSGGKVWSTDMDMPGRMSCKMESNQRLWGKSRNVLRQVVEILRGVEVVVEPWKGERMDVMVMQSSKDS